VRAHDVRDAALTLFAARGYHGTSMKDIAAALGLQAPSLYNHVASKQSLLQEIMLGSMERLVREQEAVLATTNDVTEQLRRAMEAHVRFHTRFQREVRIGNNEIASIEEPARTSLLDLRRRYARPWITLIERGVEEGRLTSIPIWTKGAGWSYSPTTAASQPQLISTCCCERRRTPSSPSWHSPSGKTVRLSLLVPIMPTSHRPVKARTEMCSQIRSW